MNGSAAREIELKLPAADDDLEHAARRAATRWRLLAPAAVARVHTVYYDTPSLALAAAGIWLRLRRDGDRRLLTLKTAGAEASSDRAAVAVRREWELPLDGADFDPAALDRLGAGDLVPAALRTQLAPRFETLVTRDRLLLAPAPGVVVEMSVDRGRARAGDAEAPIGEIELELKAGPMTALFDLALDLHARTPLRIGVENKADLGLRLLTGRKPAAVTATPLGLSRLLTGAEALRHGRRATLRHLLDNLPAALTGDGPALREMHAALRRLRAMLTPFGLPPDPDDGEAATLSADCRRLAARLAAAPRWDALVDRLRGDGADPALYAAATAMRRDAADAAVRSLNAARFTTFVLTLARRIEDERRPAAALRPLLEGPAAAAAAAQLDRLTARCRKSLLRAARGETDVAPRLRRRLRRLLLCLDMYRGLSASAPTVVESATELLSALDRHRACVDFRRRLDELAGEYPAMRARAGDAARKLNADKQEALRQAARLCQTAVGAPFLRA